MMMTSITAALLVLLLSPTPWASREGSEAAASSHLGTSTEASAEAQAEKAFQMLNKKLKQCERLQDGSTAGTEKQAQKMATCINEISRFAEKTKEQRSKSEKANQKYRDAYVAAEQMLRYLEHHLEKNRQKFNEQRQNQEEQMKIVNELVRNSQQAAGNRETRQDLGSMLDGRSSLLSMQTGQAPMMGYQASPWQHNPQPMAAQPGAPQAWGDMAAMFTPGGQNFGVPGNMVGRRPSLLQLGPESPASPMGQLQARLDREANMLEEDESAF